MGVHGDGEIGGRRVSLTLAVAAGLLLEPVWHSFFLGQVNLFLLTLVLADMHRVALGRPAGIGIGIATAIKLTPAVFVVLLLLTRRTKDAVTATATFAVCTLLAYAIAPDASRLYWLHTFYDTSRVGVPYISNQSPYGALARILRGTAEVGDWYTAIPLTIGAFGLLLAAAWARRGDWLGATAVTGVTGLLLSPSRGLITGSGSSPRWPYSSATMTEGPPSAATSSSCCHRSGGRPTTATRANTVSIS